METVKRIERPTTLILDDEVPRVPKRAAFFQRALHGDLGDKAKRERARFAFKTPFSFALLQIIRAMVKFQDGPVALREPAQHSDADANTRAIKSLSYTLGADLTGICEIPRYAWYSHKEDGSEIKPYHRYAVVMLIDQGYDTMEGASGDDWISGAQSMRGYLRGAEIAGIMGEFLRAKGFAARAQTNADSDLLHIPLILWAGLGELSRIGELVLNPFVGPRFKSVVLTTDLPLVPDKPIDFGLQTFCGNCLKCARECPCDAIPFGDKTMFNGYEIWKPDVERCTRYRVTNPKGAACGRCMKTCPINKVVDTDGALVARMASWLGIHAMWLKPLLVPIATRVDDWLGNGKRNLGQEMVVRPRIRGWRRHRPAQGHQCARSRHCAQSRSGNAQGCDLPGQHHAAAGRSGPRRRKSQGCARRRIARRDPDRGPRACSQGRTSSCAIQPHAAARRKQRGTNGRPQSLRLSPGLRRRSRFGQILVIAHAQIFEFAHQPDGRLEREAHRAEDEQPDAGIFRALPEEEHAADDELERRQKIDGRVPDLEQGIDALMLGRLGAVLRAEHRHSGHFSFMPR